MARRSSESEGIEPEATTEETVEATEGTEPEATEATESGEIDLAEFTAAVEAAIEQRDETTGVLPEAAFEPVQQAYRDLPTVKAKNKAKNLVFEYVKKGMDEDSLPYARAAMALSGALAATKSVKAPVEKAPADPTEAFVLHLASLQLAEYLVSSHVPDGVEADAAVEKIAELVEESKEAAQQLLAWVKADEETRGDEPEATPVVRAALKLSQGKAAKVKTSSSGGSTFTGERRDIGKHILEAFEGHEVGDFLTVAEIRSFKSTEYGADAPSAGAINARLFPKGDGEKCTVAGIHGGQQKDTGKRGGLKVA